MCAWDLSETEGRKGRLMMGIVVLRELLQQIILLLLFGFQFRKFPKTASTFTSCSFRGGKVSLLLL